MMNNKTILAIAFLLGGTLLTGTMAMAPVYAGGDDDDHKRYDKDGNGNKQKVEDESAGAIADCDENEVERADFDCFASAATDDSEVNTGGGGGGGSLFPVDGDCQGALVEVEIDGITICVPPGQVPE
jgi:hypothetical protein